MAKEGTRMPVCAVCEQETVLRWQGGELFLCEKCEEAAEKILCGSD